MVERSKIVVNGNFNPRTPCGVRPVEAILSYRSTHFNPRTPCGVRRSFGAPACPPTYFNPRTPCGVRHDAIHRLDSSLKFQSTHPLRGATGLFPEKYAAFQISIHAPLAGCDKAARHEQKSQPNFNPRTPCGVRRSDWGAAALPVTFQSTHPLRGATGLGGSLGGQSRISIHAPLAGCDPA